MKSIIQNAYGNEKTLELVHLPKPKVTHPKDVLIQVHVANISSGDKNINTLALNPFLKFMVQLVFGFGKPRSKIRGISGSGQVVEIGQAVTKFKVGDRVNFINSFHASVMAEYLLLQEKSILATFSNQVSYLEAAPIAFGALTAFHFINSKSIQPNKHVLIYGASGSVGTYATSLAIVYGGIVTVVASQKHHPKLQPLKPHHMEDYQSPEFKKNPKTYDVVFDAVGKLPKAMQRKLLAPNGKFYSVLSMTKEDKLVLANLNDMLAKKQLVTIIDRIYPMEAYQEAHCHVYEGHKTGNVLLMIHEPTLTKKEISKGI
jgi:NADPH:quinone reductase-like Zn-dependent oxidoreductase